MSESDTHSTIGVVVIGRNEGERLKRCLRSVIGRVAVVVYVDSGSTDGSVEFAEGFGVEVVSLDMSKPFTAARARNAGFERLVRVSEDIDFVQFIDGDCEIADGYLEAASATLREHPDTAAVAGRLRERFPEASVYNLLCEMEWETPVGVVEGVGGISMFRRDALSDVGGFNPTLIAGEEPELCVRLRLRDWVIRRIGDEMAWHDAAMTRFGQWWKRMSRGGYAAMEGAVMHGRGPFRHRVASVRSTLLWALVMPFLLLLSVLAACLISPWLALAALGILGLYALWAFRMYRRHKRTGRTGKIAAMATYFAMISKFAYLQGVVRYWRLRLFRRVPTLIEYKDSAAGPAKSSESS